MIYKAKVWEKVTVTGTGTITLSGIAQTGGFRTFSSAISSGSNQVCYEVNDSTAAVWEIGIGTYTHSSNTLSRTNVIESTNSNSLVSFAGNPNCDVTIIIPSPLLVSSGSGSLFQIPALNSVGALDPSMAPILTSPTFSYTASGQLQTVTYADGTYKTLTYSPSGGLLSTSVFTRPGNTTVTKAFSYSGTTLSSITVTVQ